MTILHHILWLRRRTHWLVICELVYSFIELVGIGGGTSTLVLVGSSVSTIDTLGVMLFGSWITLSASCFVTFLFLLWDTLRHWGRNVLHPYNWSRGCCGLGQPMRVWDLVWGRFLFKKWFSTDNHFIRGLRGALATIGILALTLLAFYNIVVQPLRSGGRSGIKLFKMPVQGNRSDYPSPLYTLGDLTRTIFLVLPAGAYVFSNRAPLALGVYVIWSPLGALNYLPLNCSLPASLNKDTNFFAVAQLMISCLPLNDSSLITDQTGPPTDILIALDFSSFALTMALDPHIQLYLGAGSIALDNLISTHELVYVFPGSHLHGLGVFSIKEQLSNQRAAAMGVLQYNHTVAVNIHALSTDPSATNWSGDPNMGTLRVSLPPLQEVYIEQEYYENSVINSLAFLGGVWTFPSGFFAAVFGSTLLLVLFGIKPLSIYGLIHTFQRQRSSLVDGDFTLSSEERDRIVAILRVHLLDIEDRASGGPAFTSSPTSPESHHYASLNV